MGTVEVRNVKSHKNFTPVLATVKLTVLLFILQYKSNGFSIRATRRKGNAPGGQRKIEQRDQAGVGFFIKTQRW